MKDCSTKVAESLSQMVREQVHEIVGQGTPSSISEMEVAVQQAVQRLAARWVEVWLGEMGGALASPEIPCACGGEASYTRLREGVLITIFGRISFRRRYYLCAQCHQGQYPLDTELGYKPGEITPQLASMAGWVGAELPFQRGSKLLEALCGITLSENTIREATQRIGAEVGEQEAEWKAESQDVASLRKRDSLPQHEKPARLYGSLDGVLVPEGEAWRELKIGSWYREARARDSTSSDQDTPPATEITYYCDITEAEEFGQLLWATGYQRWADQAHELVFVADAAVWIWNLVSDYYPHAVQIVDWYHAVEYITPIANAAFGENTAENKAWRDQVSSDLWEGHFDQVLDAFQAWHDHPQAGPVAQRAFTYYTNNRDRMRYPYFRANGYRIGSGTVESACKQIGTQRLKVAGARWSEQGARKTAKARAALLSGQWDRITARFGAVPLSA